MTISGVRSGRLRETKERLLSLEGLDRAGCNPGPNISRLPRVRTEETVPGARSELVSSRDGARARWGLLTLRELCATRRRVKEGKELWERAEREKRIF